MPCHDAVELARLFGLAHREERLDAALRADGLDPDVMPLVDQRQAEADPVRTRGTDLGPNGVGPCRRGPRRGREWDAVEVQQHRPAVRDMGERRRDAVDARAIQDGARDDVLRIDGTLQRVVLLREDPREHGLRDRDERDRIRHLEHGERNLLRRADERPRHLVVGETEPEPEPG